MFMSKPERKTIWGSFPLPDGDEILEAWNQIARKTNLTAVREGTVPQLYELGDRTEEFSAACPAITRTVEFLGEHTTKAVQATSLDDNEKLRFAYGKGAADMLELLGTIAMNREAEAIMPDFPDDPKA